MEQTIGKEVSNIWRALFKALPILKKGLAWMIGDGWQIRVGRDTIAGFQHTNFLSANVLEQLVHRRIFVLAQAANGIDGNGFTIWKSAQTLDLQGDIGTEWDNYISVLKRHGICLAQSKDRLVWCFNQKSGTLSAALAYLMINELDHTGYIPDWFSKVWKWGLPLKYILFNWLLIANRILTWDNLKKRGFHGPSCCSLCSEGEEDATHLMLRCSYTVQVWDFLKKDINCGLVWQGNNVEQAFECWLEAGREWRIIPFVVCRTIWMARNAKIFKDRYTSPLNLSHLIQNTWLDCSSYSRLVSFRCIQRPELNYNLAVAFFDGASQEGGRRCGAGALIIVPGVGRYNIIWNCGTGTNTRAELLALWSALSYAKHLGIQSLQIVGDSNIIIQWFKGHMRLESLALAQWIQRIHHIKHWFEWLSIQHVYREMNADADRLSKMAMDCPLGHLMVAKGNGVELSTYNSVGLF